MNDLCSKVTHCNFPLFADDIKIFRCITSTDDCFLLQSDISSVRNLYTANHMKLMLMKQVIFFSRETNMLTSNYVICTQNSDILRTDCIKDFVSFLTPNVTSIRIFITYFLTP
jgi:hypothetical protein